MTDYHALTKKLQIHQKKIKKKRTTYQKNTYLCSVLKTIDCITDLKSKEK